ncbi:MAG TPA: ABC transporter permease [Candidatus Eisenbacteria bacterium]
MLNRTRLLAIARKEVIQLSRDTRSLLLAFFLPTILLVLFGYAITSDVRNIATAVVDQDVSQSSRALVDAFRSSGYFTVLETPASPEAIGPLLDRSRVTLALVIPPDFAARLGAGKTAPVQAIVDGSDANTATIAIAYAQAIARSWNSGVAVENASLQAPVEARTRVWYNEDLRSRNAIVPGLVGVILMVVAAMLSSLTLAREWERGTMEQLASTPVGRFEVVFGKLLPYLGIGVIDIVLVSVLGIAVFGVPFRGDPVLFMALSLAFLTGALGLGIFISAVARSQVLATQIAMVVTFLPSFLLSGFMFSISVMPPVLQAVTFLVPARYFLVVTRGIFLKGVGAEVLYTQGLLMLLFAAVGLVLATRVFRKELE